MDAIQHNLLYRWVLDLPVEEDAWTQEVFSITRERFEAHDLHRKFFARVVAECIDQRLARLGHFAIDGTLIRSLASHKRSNATHRSTTDAEARLARKGNGKGSHLCHRAHVMMGNRSGLCLAVTAHTADGHTERATHAPTRRASARPRAADRRHGRGLQGQRVLMLDRRPREHPARNRVP